MNKKKEPLFLAVAIVATLLPITSQAWFFGPSNFDECVLAETKKLSSPVPRGAMMAVGRICQDRFPEEVYLGSAGPAGLGLEASLDKNSSAINLVIVKNNSEYAITTIRVLVSKKPCEQSTNEDLSNKWVYRFDPPAKPYKQTSNTKESSLPNENNYKCSKYDGVWGKKLPKR